MASLQESEISEIVQKVLRELTAEDHATSNTSGPLPAATSGGTARGVFDRVDDAVDAARRAHKTFLDLGLAKRYEIIHRIREVAIANAELWGRMAVEETGLGKMPDKMNKILLAARKTPGPEDIKPESFSGDHGLTLVEPAPYGVVGVITPSTNPASTIVNNAISLLSAGNACVFNPHPSAKNVCREIAMALGAVVRAAGGPDNLITVIADPTQQSGQSLMKHKDIDLLLVTGGGVVVKLAMTSGNRAICAGPGNPPVVVDETAVISKAARDIVFGAGFDNGILCTDEKSLFVVDKVANTLKREMIAAGAFEVTGTNVDKLMRAVITEDKIGKGHRHVSVNKSFIGKDIAEILEQVDIKPPSGAQIAIVEVTWDHALVMAEQMMPILPFVRCRSVEEAMEWAIISEHKFEHTFIMHSTSVANLSAMAQRCNGNIFVKNGPNLAGLGYGGEGYTTLSIAGTTGEGMTKASTFTRPRRCTLVDYFRIV
ncbi:MAG: aldehyde dehydrogenase EutE [Candidatus Zixiibacteriota bacterium]